MSVSKNIISICILAMLCWPATYVWGQNAKDSTLNEVKVQGKHNVSNETKVNSFSPGQKIATIDTTVLQQYQLQNMASLLAQQEPVFVKSYGFNGLATLNFRGSSAAQSMVLWNGVPMQNAALGVADVSTLPVLFMSKVNIIYGGSSALWGSGNVGGALLLENDAPVFSGTHSLSLVGGAGSFGQYSGGLKGYFSTRCWYFSANVFMQGANNDFSYVNSSGVITKMMNSHLQSDAVMAQAAYKIAVNNTVNLHMWWQQYDRQIPPALTELYSVKQQQDGSLRILLSWDKVKDDNRWYAKASLIKDDTHYDDKAIELTTDNTVYQYYQELGWKRRLGGWGQFILFSPVQIAWMPQGGQTKQQDRFAFAGAYDLKKVNERLDMTVNAREELADGKNVFLPGADASFVIARWLTVRANVQRTYRLPTLNELYDFPGGNTSLKPEQGWNEDAGYTAKGGLGRFELNHDVSVFNRDIHDWIYWVGGAIWTPHNIAEVHSRGVETENELACTVGKWRFHLGVNTAYVLATTVSSYIYNDGSVGRQIPYTPRYNGQINAGFTVKGLSVNYNHTYTGYRFTTTDESAWLTPYKTGNIQLLYRINIHLHTLQITLACNNVWDQRYQIVDQRPMPGINWQAGFRLGIY